MRNSIRFIFPLLLATLLSACSTKHNTWYSRHYQALVTHYNVEWNGKQAYKQGLRTLYAQGHDDFSTMLPVFPTGNHRDTTLVTTDMQRAIDKAQKARRLHSIRKKPKKNPKRRNDPKYQSFMRKEEYNTRMSGVWLLLGNAQLTKGDYLAAMATFTYVTKHFTEEPHAVIAANAGLARSYLELGWIYDAEDVIETTARNDAPRRLQPLVNSTLADVRLRMGNYSEATDALQAAVKGERDRRQRARDYYVLGQLLQRMEGNGLPAIEAYKKAARQSNSYTLALNAKVNQYEALGDVNANEALRKLRKMLKRDKYDNNREKIYIAMANVELHNDDIAAAERDFRLAIDTASEESPDLLRANMLLADMLFDQRRYIDAQPYYTQADALMLSEHPDYARVSERARTLEQLATHNDVVRQQDSLRHLADLPPEQRDTLILAELRRRKEEQERQTQKKAEEERRQLFQSIRDGEEFGDGSIESETNNLAANAATPASFYFDNKSAIEAGERAFKSKWGERQLRDDWRRANTTPLLADNDEVDDDALTEALNDGSEYYRKEKMTKADNVNEADDLKQHVSALPLTPAERQAADSVVGEALLAMASLYEQRVPDDSMAMVTYEEFERRFPRHRRLVDVYYANYLLAKKQGDAASAEIYRSRLIARFPESRYAIALADPNYERNIVAQLEQQEQLYQQTYYAYMRAHADSVIHAYDFARKEYPLAPLLPKFAFLSALAQGIKGNAARFESELQDLIRDYPESDVTSRAKTILALYQQRRPALGSSSHGSLIAMRDSMVANDSNPIDTTSFTFQPRDRYTVLVIDSNANAQDNLLQYSIATFNFNTFLVRQFDMEKRREDSAIIISLAELSDLREAFWYIDNLANDSAFQQYRIEDNILLIPISTDNLALVQKGRAMRDYIDFYNDSIAPLHPVQRIDRTEAKTQRDRLMEAALAAERLAKQQEEQAELERLEREEAEERERQETERRQREERRQKRDKKQ